MNLKRLRPNLRWYHYAVILFLGLPLGYGDAYQGSYYLAGSLMAAFVSVWAATALYRFLAPRITARLPWGGVDEAGQ